MGGKYIVIGALACVLTDPVRSERAPMPASIQACRSTVDEVQRLRCYDAAVDGSTQSPRASSPGAAVPAMQAPTHMPMFSAKVAALSFRPSGAVNVTLDNGQVWAQYGPEGRVPLRPGDSVTLRPGLFGASVLVAPSGWITKVHLTSDGK